MLINIKKLVTLLEGFLIIVCRKPSLEYVGLFANSNTNYVIKFNLVL
jgi:hypothetical protein